MYYLDLIQIINYKGIKINGSFMSKILIINLYCTEFIKFNDFYSNFATVSMGGITRGVPQDPGFSNVPWVPTFNSRP